MSNSVRQIAEDLRQIRIPVIKVTQPIGEFYVGTMSAQKLVEIADFDVRRIQLGEGIETYLGIQRELSTKRVEEIQTYVRGDDATFPTAVVLAVSERAAELVAACPESNAHFWLTLSNIISEDEEERILYRQIARVIDGQHRIAGLRGLDRDFEVNVAIFIGADVPDQATIFSTVNLAQTKVNKSLVFDLFELAKSKSPEKLVHNAVVALDRTENSPFYHRIKRLGTATLGRVAEPLAQATVVAPILRYISGSNIQVIKDRQRGRKGQSFDPLEDMVPSRLVLRPFLLADDDVGLAELIWNYFDAVSKKWPAAWSGEVELGMLPRTNGYNALMRFFRPAYLSVGKPGEVVATDDFWRIFKDLDIPEGNLNTRQYVPGTSGATALYKDLIQLSGLDEV